MDKMADEDLEIVFQRENDFYKHLVSGLNKLAF